MSEKQAGNGKRARRRARVVSAGGVVWRIAPGQPRLEIVLVQTASLRWGLPKGKRDPGERLRETALREVREETGLLVELGEKVGVMRYRFKSARAGGGKRSVDKEVHFWLMQPTGGSFSDHDHEHIDVGWFGLAEAMRRVSFRNTVDVLERAAAMLDGHPDWREALERSGRDGASDGRVPLRSSTG